MFSKIFGGTGLQAVMAGRDAAGKTTLLYKLNLGEVVTTIPTIGFNVETVEFRKTKITSMDVSYQGLFGLIKYYLRHANSLIYVVDSADREGLDENKRFLNRFMSEDEFKTMPVLIFANKQDLSNTIDLPKLTEQLELYKLNDRKWTVQPCCAVTLDGVYDGLNWLSFAIQAQMEENKNEKNKSNENENENENEKEN
ncbi:adp-ribosylation factor 4b-related [Anaeramoeba flamelloides]|uniref:Adp-ribosylation factor 4b-related n=1 Tax=Anaeramoeba flamelloides TaxID=1746091 RepID=A0ABQ8XGX7_9EUKA|nr:adp-ribosylation factor 4b-related [Anaeramoeba flamelloides]